MKSKTYANTKSRVKKHRVFVWSCVPPLRGTHTQTTAAKSAKSEGRKLDCGVVISLTLPYPAVTGNHAVRHAAGKHYRSAAADAYRQEVKVLLLRQGLAGCHWEPITGLRVRMWLCPPDRRPRDADNALKEIADALTLAGFWVDDSNQVITSWQIDWQPPLSGGAVRLVVESAGGAP